MMVQNDGAIAGLGAQTKAALNAENEALCQSLSRAERMELVVASQACQAILPTQYHVNNMRALEAFIVGGCDAFERYVLSLGVE
jgi:NADP-dependent 3-hydroxy acid dehydrogenase YdfG